MNWRLKSLTDKRSNPKQRWMAGSLIIFVLTGVLVSLLQQTPEHQPQTPHHPPGPPWMHGPVDARFTLIEYADLECPYCREHFPALKQWVATHPDVNLQWHHLPLSMHEPAATQEAKLAECAGEVHGYEGFWRAVTWIYQHTQGEGKGLPSGVELPGMSSALQECLDSSRPEKTIQGQVVQATQDGIAATPTMRLLDRKTGKAMMLYGPIEGDALLSALDLLSAPEASTANE